jgi:hypothetical protein
LLLDAELGAYLKDSSRQAFRINTAVKLTRNASIKSPKKRATQGFQLEQDNLALFNCMEERQKVWSLDPDSALAILSLMRSLARTKRIAILCTLINRNLLKSSPGHSYSGVFCLSPA